MTRLVRHDVYHGTPWGIIPDGDGFCAITPDTVPLEETGFDTIEDAEAAIKLAIRNTSA